MKKLLLLSFALMLALGVSAAQSPEQKAKAQVAMENIRVGKTFTQEQQDKMYEVFYSHNKKVEDGAYADKNAEAQGNRETNKKAEAIMTVEQKNARQQYFKELAAKREAANK